jgi:hypothetical protein
MPYAIKQRFISMNRSSRPLYAVGTVLHETATPGATDENEFQYFNSGYRGASAHAFVDYDSITQTIPWNEQAGHAGPTANKKYIGIELCHYKDAAKFNEVWKRAVWLFAYIHVNIIKVTTIDKNTLMSHAEVSRKWGETDHTDPIGYFAGFGRKVEDFRKEVQVMVNSMIGNPKAGEDKEEEPEVKGAESGTLQLQTDLNRLKITDYNGSILAEDGVYGNATRSAVRKFQSICGFLVDGIAGPQTLGAIRTILAKHLLQVGSKGSTVRYLQYRIGTAIDGSFGANTREAVIVFQTRYKLQADGIVGPITWRTLIG